MAFNSSMIISSQSIDAPKIVLYSKHGVGKTTFAHGAEAVILDCEQGAGHIPGLRRTPYLETWLQVREVLEFYVVCDDSELPKAIAIDTIDWLITKIEHFVCTDLDNKAPGDLTNSIGKSHDGWGNGGKIMRNLVSRELIPMLNKISQRGCVVILLAHATNAKTISAEGLEARMAAPDLPEKEILPLVLEWADAVLYACKSQNSRERYVITEGDNLIEAKNRYNMPARIDSLDWQSFMQAMAPATEGTK